MASPLHVSLMERVASRTRRRDFCQPTKSQLKMFVVLFVRSLHKLVVSSKCPMRLLSIDSRCQGVRARHGEADDVTDGRADVVCSMAPAYVSLV